MKKPLSAMLMCLFALTLLACAPYGGACAENTPLTLTLGDGAPIPYEEQLTQAENLIVDYTVGDQWLLIDDAITIPLAFE